MPEAEHASNNDANNKASQGKQQRAFSQNTTNTNNSREGSSTNQNTHNTSGARQTQQPSAEATRRLNNIKAALGNAFTTIGIEFTLSLKEVKKAYRRTALKCHPDKGGCANKFKELGNDLGKIEKSICSLLICHPELTPDP